MKIYIAALIIGIITVSSLPPNEISNSPTESNWRTLMELIYRPSFDNLKAQIGTDVDKVDIDFQEIRRDALVISEFTARLHQWPDFQQFDSDDKKNAYLENHKTLETASVKKHADAIYQAAKTKDIELARKSFISMTQSCNVCHKLRKSSWVPVKLEP